MMEYGYPYSLDKVAIAYARLLRDPEPTALDQSRWHGFAAANRIVADAIRAGRSMPIKTGPDSMVWRELTVELSDDPEPYPDAAAMAADAIDNGRFVVSRANCDHPIWTVEQNIDFRIAHDVCGHLASGGDFGWMGENRACDGHARAIAWFLGYSGANHLFQAELFTECIAQTGFAIQRGYFPEQVARAIPRAHRPRLTILPYRGGHYYDDES